MKQCEIQKPNDINEVFTLGEELNKKPRKYKMKMLKNHPNFDAAKHNEEDRKKAKNICKKHQNKKETKFFDENRENAK